MSTQRNLLTLTLLAVCLGIALATPLAESQNFIEQKLDTAVAGEDRQLSPETGRQTSCSSCGSSTPTLVTTPSLDLGLLGSGKLLTLIAPILVMQIITLCFLAYLLRDKGYDDSPSYYMSHESSGGGYRDSSYRSLVPDENTLNWVLEGINGVSGLYRDYQERQKMVQEE